MKKYIVVSFSILVSVLFFSGFLVGIAYAEDNVNSDTLSNVTYPILELGSCKDRSDCKIYCDEPTNIDACVSYAEKKKLFSKEELKLAKNFITAGAKGPGNCSGKIACQVYCEDKTKIDECVSYAEKNNLMSDQDLQKAKKVQAAMKKGVKFPSCQNKKECDAYCEDSTHMAECIAFAQEAGLLSEKELENTQKVLTAVKKGVKVPPCKGKEACDIYCAEKNNVDECTNFAAAAGLITSEEVRIIKEVGGKGPGGCKNKSECDSYCNNPENRESCKSFAALHNIAQPEPSKKIQQPTQDKKGLKNEAGQGQRGEGADQGGVQGLKGNKANPTKCIEDCEYLGNVCIGQARDRGKVCASDGQYCRTVYCETYGVQGDERPTEKQSHECNDNICTPKEKLCNDAVTVEDSVCRTTMEVCTTQCQKVTKQEKPSGGPEGAGSQSGTGVGPGNGAKKEQGGPGAGSGPVNGAKKEQGGPGAGSGPGNGAGQGGVQGPEGNKANPTKCIEDCEYVGNVCKGQVRDKGKVCASNGQYCRTVYCETYGVQGDERPTEKQYHECNDTVCTPTENLCNDGVTAEDSACRTTMEVCTTECQKSSKPKKPTEPNTPQPSQPTVSTPSSKPSQPSSHPPTQPKGSNGPGGKANPGGAGGGQ